MRIAAFLVACTLSLYPSHADGITKIATLDSPLINESSGLAASRVNAEILWTNNDSGDGAYVYAIGKDGRLRDIVLVRHAAAVDWEDMAAGPGPDGKGASLYLADIGDNASSRTDAAVYRISEPKAEGAQSKEKPSLSTEPTIRRSFAYPDGPRDAEALMVHPLTGIIYIASKERGAGGRSRIYAFPKEPESWWEKNTLVKIAEISLPAEEGIDHPLVTSGDISPDGKRVALLTYHSLLLFTLKDEVQSFDTIWQTKPLQIPLPDLTQAEAVAFRADGKRIFITSENLPSPLLEYELP